MDRLRQMVPVNGGTNLAQSDLNRPNRDSLTREICHTTISQYEGDLERLKAFLKKILPVASLTSLCHDAIVDIGGGDTVSNKIEDILSDFEIKGRRTIGLFGYHSLTMPSGPHCYAVQFIWRIYMLMATVLGIEDIGMANMLLCDTVEITGNVRRVLQSGTTNDLADLVEDYCWVHLQKRIKFSARRSSNAYEKEPDQSFQPAYQRIADNSTGLPTVICEVTTGQVGRLIFNCLSSLAGSRGKIDLSFGTDLAVNNQGLTRISLVVFDSTITTLVGFAEGNQSVACFTRDKVENRLIHLHYLEDHLHDNARFESYLDLEHTIRSTIEYYERTHEYLTDISAEDVVETCRVVLMNAQVVQMTIEDDDFIVTDVKEEPLDHLVVKVESFLGLLMDEPQVKLGVERIYNIYRLVAKSCANDELEGISSPIPLRLTRWHIKDKLLEEFVASHNLNSDQAFIDGQVVTVQNVKLGHLREDSVITPAAKAYLDVDEEEDLRSRALRISCALCWFREKEKEGMETYDLADLDRQAG